MNESILKIKAIEDDRKLDFAEYLDVFGKLCEEVETSDKTEFTISKSALMYLLVHLSV